MGMCAAWGPSWMWERWGEEFIPPKPTFVQVEGSQPLLFPGEVHIVYGRGGQGKTWFSLAAVTSAANAGLRCVIIDYEGSEELTRFRLKRLVGMTGRIPANVATPECVGVVMAGSRGRRRGPGGGPQSEKRDRFARLIAQGQSATEASAAVGVHRRTGTRWKYGRTERRADGRVYEYERVKVSLAPSTSERYLSSDERDLIADLLRDGKGVRAIAETLHRAPSTISRELRRNAAADGAYRSAGAHALARQRRGRPRARRISTDAGLRAQVQQWLTLRWSPEQIAHSLRRAASQRRALEPSAT